MPYKIVQRGSEFCVAKKDTGEIIKGDCHKTHEDARKQMAAIIINEKGSSNVPVSAIPQGNPPAPTAKPTQY